MVVPLAMGWRHVLFASWPVTPERLADHLPDGLAVDAHEGSAWLSVVPFTNVDVRPRGLPAAAGFDLPELNLRTYVARGGEPGVYFFSLDADGLLGVLGARLFHHLPYFYADVAIDAAGDRVRFECERRHPRAAPARYAATYGPTDGTVETGPGTLADFLTERYRFYAEGRRGCLRYADVTHDRWPLSPAAATVRENTLFRADGFDPPDGDPVLYYSPGVDVVASRSRRWRGG